MERSNWDKYKIMTMMQIFIDRFIKNDIIGLAAQLSYFFILSLFPLLIFLVTLIPYLPITQEDMIGLIRDFAPVQTMDFLETTLAEIMSNRSSGLLSFGIIGTIWSASNGMNAVIKALNRAYNAEERRPFLIARGMSIILTIGMIIVIIIVLVLPVFGKQIGKYLFHNLGFSMEFVALWNALRWVVTPIVLFLVFQVLYFLAPSEKIRWKSVRPGAVFASIGWIIVSLGFSSYISNFGNFTAAYGSLGGMIVLMLWLYLSGMILMIGGELNAVLAESKKNPF
ncbi:membrane protein [Bacillus chungangensis]|uniref:Membrane protein n=2 Tax=Bacillus chungangensis TaxID=587633 RepID=A0ABT9WSE5_9BACI|nr:membrane protein [Bacillus chungangensis]